MQADKTRSTGLWRALSGVVRVHPSGRAMVSTVNGETWTFGRLAEDAEARARTLAGAGLGEGHTVVLALPNSPEFVLVFYALTRLGATVVLASSRYGTSEVRSIRAQARPDAWILPRHLAPGYAGLKEGGTLAWHEVSPGVQLALEREAGGPSPLDDLDAIVKFTSGSTGEPKGIRLTAPQMMAEARQVASTLEFSPDDRVLALVPVSHSYGFDLGVLGALLAGATLAVGDSNVLPLLIRELEAGGNTVFLGVPVMYRLLLEGPRAVDLSHLRWLLSCTAPLSPRTIEAFHGRFGAVICQHYGSSETGALTNHLPEAVLERVDSVGRPMDGVRIRVLDASGRECGPGEEGEVVAESAAIARGYVKPPEGPSPFRGGRYHTGDLGTLDAGGYLTVVGRIDHVINVGGLKVSPLEVARVLEGHPGVREAFVYGALDDRDEHSVRALVTLHTEVEVRDILRHCHEHLADYKVPRKVEIVAEMPLGPTGKIRVPRAGSEA